MLAIRPFVRRDVTYDPFREMEDMQRRFFGEDGFFKNDSLGAFKTDIQDKGDSYLLEADLPGFKKDQKNPTAYRTIRPFLRFNGFRDRLERTLQVHPMSEAPQDRALPERRRKPARADGTRAHRPGTQQRHGKRPAPSPAIFSMALLCAAELSLTEP